MTLILKVLFTTQESWEQPIDEVGFIRSGRSMVHLVWSFSLIVQLKALEKNILVMGDGPTSHELWAVP